MRKLVAPVIISCLRIVLFFFVLKVMSYHTIYQLLIVKAQYKDKVYLYGVNSLMRFLKEKRRAQKYSPLILG